jgi:hypothetical protein
MRAMNSQGGEEIGEKGMNPEFSFWLPLLPDSL